MSDHLFPSGLQLSSSDFLELRAESMSMRMDETPQLASYENGRLLLGTESACHHKVPAVHHLPGTCA